MKVGDAAKKPRSCLKTASEPHGKRVCWDPVPRVREVPAYSEDRLGWKCPCCGEPGYHDIDCPTREVLDKGHISQLAWEGVSSAWHQVGFWRDDERVVKLPVVVLGHRKRVFYV